ncbi:MAG: WecB/TagA/CpsF family glycosyltransferase [Elusimicrobia bacterium]|nr:WecB/TagA/CpsF family glycosyltransferase [Elusimicrobiota bacterium]
MTLMDIAAIVRLSNFFSGSFDEAVGRLEAFAAGTEPKFHVSLNADALFWASRNAGFKKALEEADLVTADGVSIALAGRLFGFSLAEKLAGIDLLEGCLKHFEKKGRGVCFVGARPAVLEYLKEYCRQAYPGLGATCEAWSERGDFADELGGRIRRRGDQALFAGLPRPYQEIWLFNNKFKLGAPLMMGVGGSFEVLSGEAKRAPQWMRNLSLEWLFRFLQEPRRRIGPTLRATIWFSAYLAKLWLRKQRKI